MIGGLDVKRLSCQKATLEEQVHITVSLCGKVTGVYGDFINGPKFKMLTYSEFLQIFGYIQTSFMHVAY